jgi:predicted O-linked N-acetylglucosamine transferase (SPINDLY family)
MLPVLEAHDRSRFEIVGYAELARPDGVTERIAKTLDRWRSTLWQSDAEVADAIIRDNVDVLVFLAGHFDVNRLSVAAHKPAPILVSVHDPVTSGFESMDYLVADPVLAPRAGRERFVERVVRVPSFFCHAPLVGAPEPGDPPMGRLGHVTFGSSNNPMKINADVVALWSRVLNAVPAATLRLKYRNAFADPGLCHMFRAAFARHGIDGSRLVFLGGGEPTDVHLNFYRDVDAVLDCFPFTGSTTTFEALWMGVPVVTLIGDSMVHRWSAGILTPLGRRDWVAADAEEYVRIAARLAADADLVADHRRRLRGELAASPLCDGVRLAQQLERLYRSMWRRWCRRAAV